MKKLEELSVQEKLRLICGKDAWHTEDFDGKLMQIFVSDGPVGLRTMKEEGGEWTTIPAVAFPSVQVLANTWNTELAQRTGEALADECYDRGVDILLAPGVNIKRDARNGRNFEYFSEDPVVAGEMAKAYIEGVQGRGIGVCLKHFCCNNLEDDRLHQSSDVDERTLREIYYRPFEIACEAKPVSVMCSYNRVNGVFASENTKGFRVLREEFGFDGAIISDWFAVRNRAKSAMAGLDLEMPFSPENYEQLKADYAAGKLSDEALDECAGRVLELIARCKKMQEGKRAALTVKERAERAKEVAAEGMVLLKNEGVLPLAAGKKLAVSGMYAAPGKENLSMLAGGGSSCVVWAEPEFDLPARLKERGFAVRFEGAVGIDRPEFLRHDGRKALLNAAGCDVNIVCVGTGGLVEYEDGDRKGIRLAPAQERLIRETASRAGHTVVVLFAGAAVEMTEWIDCADAVLFAGFPGMGSDAVIADLLTGAVNPSGKLTETFPELYEDTPAAQYPASIGVTRYGEGLDVGYRCHDGGVPALFPFGHGLSYAAFSYTGLSLTVEGSSLKVRFFVENESAHAGKEVVQVYVRECAPLVYRPDKELKAFAKPFVSAYGSAEVELALKLRDFAHWSVAEDKWTADDGVYEILIAASAEDIRLSAKVKLEDGVLTVLV